MSNAIFPTLPGLDIEISKEIEFSTIIQASQTGKELRVGQRVYPMYRVGLKFNFLRDSAAYPELKQLCGFYMSRTGPLDSFLFTDPDDNSVTAQSIGTGNGTNTVFQALRAFGSFVEPVFNLNAVTQVTVNGTPVAYSANPATGVITCSVPPANGAAVAYTGTFYYRARFLEDKINVRRFLNQVWSGQSVPIIATLQDKIT